MVSKATNAGAVTVSSILDILSRQLEVAECDVFGYLNVESDDLVILVRPVVKSPTMLQVRLHKSPTMLQVQLTWFSAICDTHISRLQRAKPHIGINLSVCRLSCLFGFARATCSTEHWFVLSWNRRSEAQYMDYYFCQRLSL